MTQYLAPLDDRFAADLADMRRRLATLEQQAVQAKGTYSAFPCTSSTRPSSPNVGQEVYETDTTRLLVWSGTAWEQKTFGQFVCTSSTRPASPFQSLEIYETNTTQSATYSGSAWQYGMQQVAPTQVLGSTAASVTFPSLPPVARLHLFWRGMLSAAGAVDLLMQVDGDAASHYLWAKVEASNGAAAAGHGGALVSSIKIGVISGDTANYMGSGRQDIDGWGTSSGYMSCTGTYGNFDLVGTDWSGTASGMYATAGPHTSLKVFPSSGSFAVGSQFSLYGSM